MFTAWTCWNAWTSLAYSTINYQNLEILCFYFSSHLFSLDPQSPGSGWWRSKRVEERQFCPLCSQSSEVVYMVHRVFWTGSWLPHILMGCAMQVGSCNGTGKWNRISVALFQSTDRSKLLYNTCQIHPFTHTHSHTDGRGCHARCQLLVPASHQEQFGVQHLAQGHFHMQPWVAGIQKTWPVHLYCPVF